MFCEMKMEFKLEMETIRMKINFAERSEACVQSLETCSMPPTLLLQSFVSPYSHNWLHVWDEISANPTRNNSSRPKFLFSNTDFPIQNVNKEKKIKKNYSNEKLSKLVHSTLFTIAS